MTTVPCGATWPRDQPSNVAAPARDRGTLVIRYCTSTVTSPPAVTVRSSRPTCATPGQSR